MSGVKRIILASASPRRKELLKQIGVTYKVYPAHIDESVQPCEPPENYVRRLAIEKAQIVKASCDERSIVLAADTTVVVGHEILGKPTDSADATRMLKLLSGVTHRVLTAVAVTGEGLNSIVSESRVTFKYLTQADLDWYSSTGESQGKAGAYAIQGKAAVFITRLEGSFSGVMGLPLYETVQMLSKENVGIS